MATGRKTVAVGEIIQPTTWGNPLWDQSVQCFATAADRDNQFPIPVRHPGAPTYLEDVKRLEVWDGAGWSYGPTGVLHTATYSGGQALGTSPTDLTNLAFTGTLQAGRRIRITGNCQFGKGAGEPAGVAALTIANQANADYAGAPRLSSIPVGPSNMSLTVDITFDAVSTASYTFKLRGWVTAGNLFLQTGLIVVEDAGRIPS